MKKMILKVICIILVGISLGLMFAPCWTAGDQSVSPAGYIYRPSNFRSLTTELRSVMNTKKLATHIAMPIFVLLACCIVLLISSILKFKSNAPSISCLFIGLLGLGVCLINPIIRYGSLLDIRIGVYSAMIIVGFTAALLCRTHTENTSKLEMPDIRGNI